MTTARNAPYVISQPTAQDIHSNFKMFSGERLLYQSKMNSGCCGLGDTHFTTVTDTRYVARREQCICCGCCFKKPYYDTCIYLHDIAQLNEEAGGEGCLAMCCKYILSPCYCLCWCCGPTKQLKLHGSFGSHLIHIYGKDVPDFESMMAEAVAKEKLSGRH